MVSQKTLKDFYEKFTYKSLVSVKTIMEKLQCSRPTATNLVSALLNRRLTYKKSRKKNNCNHTFYLEPFAITGDSQKWYKLQKH